MSPMTPPPKARRMASRSAPAWASCSARDSTLAGACGVAGREKEDGGRLSGKLARKGLCQRAQMSGEVTTKGRGVWRVELAQARVESAEQAGPMVTS